MNQTIKVSIGIAIAVLMTACGSNGESEKDIISSGDTGECIKIPVYLTKYEKVIAKARSVLDGTEVLVTTGILESNKKSFKIYTESTAMPIRSEYKNTINIKNNYIHFTKIETVIKTLDGEVKGKETSTFDPYFYRLPSGKACKGQSWKDTYKYITKRTVPEEKEYERAGNKTSTIEDINILKTVEAGEFSTYIHIREYTTDGETHKTKTWVDVETGMGVYFESYRDNKLFSTQELIEFTR